VFGSIKPWHGQVSARYIVDFLGVVTPKEFLEPWGYEPNYVDGAMIDTSLPTIAGEQ
jgi:hypothetical protein